MNKIKGIGVSPGIAIGKTVILSRDMEVVIKVKISERDVQKEIKRYLEALKKAEREIELLEQKAKRIFPAEISSVFHAHLNMVKDEIFTKKIPEYIKKYKVNAEWAVQEQYLRIKKKLDASSYYQFHERIADIEDVSKHILTALQSIDRPTLDILKEDIILISYEFGPSDMMLLHHPRIAGIVTQAGGETSHTAIIAKALNIPAVLSARDVMNVAVNGGYGILDGNEGIVYINPTKKVLNDFKKKKKAYEKRLEGYQIVVKKPDLTKDGVKFDLKANVELMEELKIALKNGAKGIGLYRSEFLYISKYPNLPTEEDHFLNYKNFLETMEGLPVTIRTFDLGGRKFAKETLHLREGNPVLGMRGIRLCLNSPEIFIPQLKGLLRASVYGNLRIMLPMVCCVDEVIETRKLIENLKKELRKEKKNFKEDIPVGIMVEVPSSVLILDLLEPYVDFFSIGTNDLIQYTLAVDRNNPAVSKLFTPLHPAILRSLKTIIDFGIQKNKEVSICGEMAANPIYAAILLGFGIRSFSMEPTFIPQVKEIFINAEVKNLEKISSVILKLPTAKEVNELILEEMEKILPESLRCAL